MPPEKVAAATSGLPFPEIRPWDNEVYGSELMSELVRQLRRYIVADDSQLVAIGLWTIFAHAHERFDHSPILAVTAPTIRSGKTSVLNVISKLVPRALPSSNVTPAIFRAIDQWSPTLLADEADTYLAENRTLIGVLNSGFDRHTAVVVRNTGENFGTPRNFSTWCPKAIGAVGRLPPSLADRSIEIRLQRKRADEQVERLSIHRLEELHMLARKILRWVADHREQLGQEEPPFPPNLTDRDADKWRPLLSIAAALGKDCLCMAQCAAVHLGSMDDAAERLSDAERLIRDMAAVFEEQPEADWIGSEALAAALMKLPDSHWTGRQIAGFTRFIAAILKPFRIKPRQKNLGENKVLRGYFRVDVLDLAARYVVPVAGPASTGAVATAATAATAATTPDSIAALGSGSASDLADKSVAIKGHSGSSADSAAGLSEKGSADDLFELPLFGGRLDGEQPRTLQ